MTETRDLISEIAGDCSSKVHFARQICGKNDDALHAAADRIADRIRQFPRDVRILRADLRDYDDFPSLIHGILKQIFADPKFDPSDTLFTREEIESEDREQEWFYQLYCILKEDFPEAGIFLLLMLEHYELAGERWRHGGDFGKMRQLAVESLSLSYLFFSDRPVSKVSPEPCGSSPLFNIFTPPTEADQSV